MANLLDSTIYGDLTVINKVTAKSLELTDVLTAAYGGTGITSYTAGDILYASDSSTLATVAKGASNTVLLSGNSPTWGKVPLSTHVSGTLPIGSGGTGVNSYSSGSMLYYSSGTALSVLSKGASNTVLLGGDTPSWGQVSLTSRVTGTLPTGSGGTGLTSYAQGDILYYNSGSALSRLAKAAAGNVLISGTTPSWGKVDLGSYVSGTLPVSRGGTGRGSYTTGDLLYASGSTSIGNITAVAVNNVLISNGAGAAPKYGKVGLTTHVEGILAVGNGGTGKNSFTSNALLKGNESGAIATSNVTDTGSLITLGTSITINGSISTVTNITASGTIKAQYFDSTSSRFAKKDIKATSIDALSIIKNTQVVDFKYKTQTDNYVHTGFIAEDAHKRMTGPNGDAMSVGDTIGILIKAVQELNSKIDKLEK